MGIAHEQHQGVVYVFVKIKISARKYTFDSQKKRTHIRKFKYYLVVFFIHRIFVTENNKRKEGNYVV